MDLATQPKTFSTVQISEHLEGFNISVSPQELKNISADLLQKIYLTLMYELEYEAEHFEMLTNFEAINELERKEDYDDILPLANFCLALNKVFAGFSAAEVSHYDFFCPKWKDQRLLVSIILNYCLYARELKAIYQAVCDEFVDVFAHKKGLQSEVSALLLNINKVKSLISQKKNDEKISEILKDVITEMKHVAVLKEQRKAEWSEIKRELEEEKKIEDDFQRVLELIEKENDDLEKNIIQNPEIYELEIEEIKKKISQVKHQINHKKIEDANIENKYVVNTANNAPLSVISALPQINDQFDILEMEVRNVKDHSESQQSHIAKRVDVENKIKEQTKTHARLKEEKVSFISSMEKQKMQIMEAIKDKEAEVEELKKKALKKSLQNKAQSTKKKNLSTEKENELLRQLEDLEKKTKKITEQDQTLRDKSEEFEKSEIQKLEHLMKIVAQEREKIYNMMNKYMDK